MTLAELTEEEGRLAAEVERVTGSMEQKRAELERRGVFRDYARVHSAYSALAAGGSIEALKRALFLQWFAVSEPSCFSGLGEVEPESERRVFELLDSLAANGLPDPELRWMLPYYYRNTDFHFDSQPGLPMLRRWLQDHKRVPFRDEYFHDPALGGRGQMSDYWYRPGYSIHL